MQSFPQLVFSGVQPTGNLHLGNYLGAITRFVSLQETHRLHLLRGGSACDHGCAEADGADVEHSRSDGGFHRRRHRPESTSSSIKSGREHAELAWIFNCVARLGWLNRMTQCKDKAGKDRENASHRAVTT